MTESAELIAGKTLQRSRRCGYESDCTYVGAVITPAKTVYHTEWGCPVGGENTVLITGSVIQHIPIWKITSCRIWDIASDSAGP